MLLFEDKFIVGVEEVVMDIVDWGVVEVMVY